MHCLKSSFPSERCHQPLLTLSRCLPPTAGLKQIHALSIQGNYELRIDLEDFENSTAYAQYGTFGVGLFSVDPDDDGYPLTVGDYSGSAGKTLWGNSRKLRRHKLAHFSQSVIRGESEGVTLNMRPFNVNI